MKVLITLIFVIGVIYGAHVPEHPVDGHNDVLKNENELFQKVDYNYYPYYHGYPYYGYGYPYYYGYPFYNNYWPYNYGYNNYEPAAAPAPAPAAVNPVYHGGLTFIGKFKGTCDHEADGLYYIDERSFAYCSGGRKTIQACADGSANPAYGHFKEGERYQHYEFCSINLAAQINHSF